VDGYGGIIMENKKITVFNAMSTLRELAKGQEELVKAVEEIATVVAVNNCSTRLDELRKTEKMREQVIDYLIEIGADKDYIHIPVETLREWKLFLNGSCKGKPCKISGSVSFGKVKIYNRDYEYKISMV
jgi:hypothetical protein